MIATDLHSFHGSLFAGLSCRRRPYAFLKERGLVTEDVRNHQFRFKEIVDPESNRNVFLLEHEVRSMHHPMFHRVMVNRNAEESGRRYRRGHDALVPYR